jgi:mRNA-degrading endonuclease RelE of RelBE toxin-antitoxin system
VAFAIRFTASAANELMRLPQGVRRLFDHGFGEIQRSPLRSVPGLLDVHALKGGRGLWTMRVRGYRGLYRVDGSEIVFVAFRPRPTAYRDLSKV